MIPKPPPREGSLGFLFIPPYRIQGISIAGEMTVVQAPELDIAFDMGMCPRSALASKYVAISHGHMDHVGGLAYYCSQRKFQGMGVGSIICDARLAQGVRRMMAGFVDLEQQVTPYELIAMEPEQEVQIKNGVIVRGFHTEHTSPSMGYVVVEKRSKLKPEHAGLPQDKLKELKDKGEEITRILDIPLVAYLGDTAPGPALLRNDVRQAQVIVCECTFIEEDHRDRARIGKHMHLDDIIEWLPVLECQALVLTHLSRRSNLGYARKRLSQLARRGDPSRVMFLMDHKFNRERYEKQLFEAQQREAELVRSGKLAPPGVPQQHQPPRRGAVMQPLEEEEEV